MIEKCDVMESFKIEDIVFMFDEFRVVVGLFVGFGFVFNFEFGDIVMF